MVRKSKSGMDRSSLLHQTKNVDLVAAEVACLKAQNIELAKSLVDTKALVTQLTEETNRLQKELLAKSILTRKLKNFVNEIHASAAISLRHTREILQVTNIVQQINNVNTVNYSSPQTHYSSTPNSSNRMHAVKPMVGGHVILRPTINLRRINEISLEELQRLTNSQTQANEQSTTEYPNENEEVENEEASGIDGMNNLSEEQRNHLTTLQEESLNEGTSNRSQHPILSGVFQDVRVYLSPVPDVAQYCNSQNVNVKPRSKKNTQSNNLLSAPNSPMPQPCTSSSSTNSIEDLNNSKPGVNFLSSTRIYPLSTTAMAMEPQPSTSFAHDLSLPSTSQISNEDEESIVDSTNETRQIPIPKFEAPSLSSSSDSMIETVMKEQTLKSLGLIPTSAKQSISPEKPASPATAVLKRRRTKEPNSASNDQLPLNTEGASYVTRRKSKTKIFESIRFTRSKQKKEKVSLDKGTNIKQSPKKIKVRKSEGANQSPNNSLNKTREKAPRKSLTKIKVERKSNNNKLSLKSSELVEVARASTSADSERKYSPKKLRVKRGPPQGTFKELSLNKKLRR